MSGAAFCPAVTAVTRQNKANKSENAADRVTLAMHYAVQRDRATPLMFVEILSTAAEIYKKITILKKTVMDGRP